MTAPVSAAAPAAAKTNTCFIALSYGSKFFLR
jgi:hypothetical protein